MKSTRNSFSDNYNKPFPTALRKIMESTGKTQKDISEFIGKKTQSVSQYVNGQSEPGYETLVKIADFFDCSVDYLLGRTDDPSINPCAVDDLGISKNAIISILSYKKKCDITPDPNGMNALNAVLTDELFYRSLYHVHTAMTLIQKELERIKGMDIIDRERIINQDYSDQDELIDVLLDYSREKSENFVLLSKDEYIQLHIHRALDCYEQIIETATNFTNYIVEYASFL